MRALLSTECKLDIISTRCRCSEDKKIFILDESGKFDKIVFVIKMTTENEHTASSQISEDETQKMHKKNSRCRRGVSAK